MDKRIKNLYNIKDPVKGSNMLKEIVIKSP
jgi:hypothetical protein